VLARKPLIGTIVENVLTHTTGGLNIDACRIASHDDQLAEKYASVRNAPPRNNAIYGSDNRPRSDGRLKPHVNGRFPANLIHDGSDEVMEAFAAFGETTTSRRKPEHNKGRTHNSTYGKPSGLQYKNGTTHGDTGLVSRFFYCAKASKAERNGSKHPTIKPLALMRWLVRLVTPPNGLVLDPFAGTGTTGEAALLEGFDCLLIERDPESIADIERRLSRLKSHSEAA